MLKIKTRQPKLVSGGVAMFIKHSYNSEELQVDSNMKAIATKIHLFPQTIAYVYIPNNYSLPEPERNNLINKLSKSYILLGDFNNQNNIWGSKRLI
jgi:hypothetical protein